MARAPQPALIARDNTRDLDAPLVPCSYVARWVEFLAARGVARDGVLANTGLTSEMLDNPLLRFTFRSVGVVVWNGAKLAGDDLIGFEYGLQLNAASHGWLGIALITAASLGDALVVGERYMNVRSYPWHIQMSIDGDVATMRFVEAFSLGPLRLILLHIFLGAMITLGEFMMEDTLPRTGHEFAGDFVPDPALVARYQHRLPRLAIGSDGSGGNYVRFANRWLAKPLRWSDPVAHREALAVLDEQQRLLLAGGPVPDRVRGLLAEATSSLPGAADVASRLGLSVRTLNRHLRDHHTSFLALRDDARRHRAMHLLRYTEESVEAIAGELGYADANGLHRAFRRWLGVSPQGYRERARRREPDGA